MVASCLKRHISLIFGQTPESAGIMIGVLVFPDFQLLDAAGPISVFEIGARFAENAPSIRVLAVTPGPVRSSWCRTARTGAKAVGRDHHADRGGR
jgi:transcriptional regulator GlxA family with amidase domain